MKIVHLIGNGFDLNIPIKTSYKDFYKYYVQQKSKHPLVADLKTELQRNKETDIWADFEFAFGVYTKHLKSLEEFDVVFDDVKEHLALYLDEVQAKLPENSEASVQKLYNDIAYPYEHLLESDKVNYLQPFANQWSLDNWSVNFISFNYTTTAEKLLHYEGRSKQIMKFGNGRVFNLTKIEHIHGFTDRNMILGVNDISQIANETFRADQDVVDALVKINSNTARKHLVSDRCQQLISEANLICLFGLSMGETDKMWWELIGEQLKRKSVRVIIFELCEGILPNAEYKRLRIERRITDKFLSKTKLTEEQKREVKERIFIGLNTNIFKLSTP